MEHENCNCEDCYEARGGHELCFDCGSIVGHGCPDSDPCDQESCDYEE